MTTYPAAPLSPVRHRVPAWARVLVSGLLLWVATVAITFATGNPNLVPTLILLGSFLIPVTFVVYAFGRADEVLTAQRIFTAFIYGGVLGVLGATVLEAVLLQQPSGLLTYIGVGLIEEAVKLAALWALARHLLRYAPRDGMVLGAAVGFSFAALESAGYAFTALFGSSGLSLLNLVETEALRGILAPFGHGLWTAILGGVLFATAARSRHGRPRLTGSLLGWYLLMVLLHALWDASSSIANWLTLLLTGTPTQWTLIGQGQAPAVAQTQVHVYTAINWGLLLLDAAIGITILAIRWHRNTTTHPQPEPLPAPPAGEAAAAATTPRS